jgi:hypothetical protein
MRGVVRAVDIAAFDSVNRIERTVTRRLVVRQIGHGGRISRDMARYGPRATVRLCVARAYQVYLSAAGLVSIGFTLAGWTIPTLFAFGLVMVFGALLFASLLIGKIRQREWINSGRQAWPGS